MKRATREDYDRRLLRAQRLVESRLDQPVSPEEVARHAGLSLHHFHRIFRAQLGESVMQHVRRLRLERAARALKAQQLTPSAVGAPNRRLIELALEAGYESHEAFTRAFTDHFGVTPSAYRDQLGRPSPAPRAVAVPVRVERFAAVPVFFRRHRGGYGTVGESWAQMVGWAMQKLPAGAALPPLYGICPDDTEVTEEALLRFDVCVAQASELDGDASVEMQEVPAGRYAVGLHIGPYHELHQTYLDVIGRWFPSSGYELAPDPVVEFYVDNPSCTPAAQLRTEVRVRIAE